jgi:hypothetical protein
VLNFVDASRSLTPTEGIPMKKIVLWMSISVDGYFEGPDRDLSWHRSDDELHRHINDRLAAMSAFLDGRSPTSSWPTSGRTADLDPSMQRTDGRVRRHLAGHAQRSSIPAPGTGRLECHRRPRGGRR